MIVGNGTRGKKRKIWWNEATLLPCGKKGLLLPQAGLEGEGRGLLPGHSEVKPAAVKV